MIHKKFLPDLQRYSFIQFYSFSYANEFLRVLLFSFSQPFFHLGTSSGLSSFPYPLSICQSNSIVLFTHTHLHSSSVIHLEYHAPEPSVEKCCSNVQTLVLSPKGNLLVITFVSYFGARLHRPKLIGGGCLIMGVGTLLVAMPQFFMEQ